jgi:hypothetical protein
VLLWFAGLAWVIVWLVFQDPAFDYRLVVVGALLPDGVDAPFGGARVLHTLLFSVALLAAVMLATRHRRRLRRHLLALPVGTFLHLVLDGMWARTKVFWWPLFGTSFAGRGLPSLSRPWPLLVLEELVGAVALAWCWQHFELGDRTRRSTFWRTGRVGREFGGPPRGGQR